MASKQTTSSGRSSGKSKKSGTQSKSTEPRFNWKREVLLFVVLIFCVIVFIANFGRGGALGSALSGFFFGLFGVMSYIFPVALFLLFVFWAYQRTVSKRARYRYPGRTAIKSVAGSFCFIFVCVLCHVVYFGRESIATREAYGFCSRYKAGGGVLGALFTNGMTKGIGFAAALVITFIILILCVVLISERSLFRGLADRVSDSQDKAEEKKEKREKSEPVEHLQRASRKSRKEEFVEEEEEPWGEETPLDETKPLRRDQQVKGVSPDLTLAPDGKNSEQAVGDTAHMSEVDMSGYDYDDGIEDVWEPEGVEKPNIYMSGKEAEEEDATPVEKKAAEKPEKKETAATTKTTSSTRKTKASTKETAGAMEDISASIAAASKVDHGDYVFPSIRLLKKGDPKKTGDSRQHLQQMSARLQETLETFGVNARVTNVVCGPTVTQYEIQPEMGVKVSKILNLADDIKLNLMVSDIRIEAPIPGKAAVGIEVPNQENVTVALRDLIESKEFQASISPITFCVGKDIAGNVIVGDIAQMPHLLIAGATGSGKSVCINTIIMSILYKSSPDEVKLIMIDPKVVELSVYNNIPHLLIPVVTDPKKAAGALHWAVAEMTDRYNRFAEYGVRDIEGYNNKVDSIKEIEDENKPQRMANLVIIVDELSDLMMVAASDVEDAICRLAQLARAAGIHLIIATQRPSVNVITGLIKANMPSRIAFAVTSGVDSRTILDMNGAEKLLGKGDMLYYPQGYSEPVRVQGGFISDAEVARVVNDVIEKNGEVSYNESIEDEVKTKSSTLGASVGFPSSGEEDHDVYFAEAARFLIEKEKGSIGMLQRNFKIGFNRAARIMDQLEEAGIVGPEEGTKPRRVLISMEEFEQMTFE